MEELSQIKKQTARNLGLSLLLLNNLFFLHNLLPNIYGYISNKYTHFNVVNYRLYVSTPPPPESKVKFNSGTYS